MVRKPRPPSCEPRPPVSRPAAARPLLGRAVRRPDLQHRVPLNCLSAMQRRGRRLPCSVRSVYLFRKRKGRRRRSMLLLPRSDGTNPA